MIRRFFTVYFGPLILAEWGGLMLYLSASGRLSAYLHPMFRPLVLVTGLLLAATALVMMFTSEDECCGHDHGEEGHGHSHAHGADSITVGRLGAWLVLVVPLALAIIISPDQFGATFVHNRGSIESAAGLPVANNVTRPTSPVTSLPKPENDLALPGENQPGAREKMMDAVNIYQNSPTPHEASDDAEASDKGPMKCEVTDLVYATQDDASKAPFLGKEVKMIGQLDTSDDPPKLVRFLMVCCAADLQPVTAQVKEGGFVAPMDSMSWVRVVGKVSFVKTPAGDVPLVEASEITPIPKPEEPYLY